MLFDKKNIGLKTKLPILNDKNTFREFFSYSDIVQRGQ